ncbi:hypothetical protein F9K94_21105 [Brucella tritici]|uniref:Lipoprotein n=1 Tax=Brucella tritici TaxID=94626 RepID=A0A7V8B0P9_9HYPH|nr:hypothetical protein [Brucella tritici]KAB2655058.1 hypothetical protein F9K94_21105 [Brucella tritici]
MKMGKLGVVLSLCASLTIVGCVKREMLSDNNLLMDNAFGVDPSHHTPEEQARLKELLAQRAQNEQLTEVGKNNVGGSRSYDTYSPSSSFSQFPPVPPDDRADCEGNSNTPFNRWIENVQAKASSGGACLNSRGAELINREGAKRSRYCASILSGSEREQSLQQAIVHDQAANEAKASAASTCS